MHLFGTVNNCDNYHHEEERVEREKARERDRERERERERGKESIRNGTPERGDSLSHPLSGCSW